MDWIKLEKSTPDKPEIFEMAEFLDIDPDEVLGKIIRVWTWLDSNSENGHTSSVTVVLIKRVTGHNKFADAMLKVGWLEKSDEGYNIPNYARHLGKSSKKRALDAERQRKSREVSQNSHAGNVTKALPEKIREDKSTTTREVADSSNAFVKQIFNLYGVIATNMPRMNKLSPQIIAKIKSRCKDEKTYRKIEKWEKFFTYCNNNTFLSGRGEPNPNTGKVFKPNLDWIVNSTNFYKILNGNFNE